MGSLTQQALQTTPNMDNITGGKKLKDLFRGDSALHDNFLFKLHHQANFAVILFGVAFISGMNYLNKNAIECTGGDEFSKQYCWLHGAGHIESDLHPSDIKCKADQNKMTAETKNDGRGRHSHYYLWVPFVLMLCLFVIKAPRVLWKEVCERGMIAGAVGGRDGQPADKIAERFRKLRRKSHKFQWGFFFCELLNIVSVIICFTMLNTLFGGNFMNYGSDFAAHSNRESTEEGVNPLCNVFPSVVSCNVLKGGATGGVDKINILCLLSNNLFNQYYFLIIWFWWVTLLALSALGLVYRLAQVFVPGASQCVFLRRLEPHGITLKELGKLQKFSPADFFLLGRICQNLKGSQIVDVLKELNKPASKAKGEVKETRVEREEEEEEESEGNTERETMLTEVTTG